MCFKFTQNTNQKKKGNKKGCLYLWLFAIKLNHHNPTQYFSQCVQYSQLPDI